VVPSAVEGPSYQSPVIISVAPGKLTLETGSS
jgi:hypothetical protein